MESTRPAPATVRFGVFEIDLRSGELRKQGVRVKLQDRPFRTLQILLEHAGEVVTREELRQRLWPLDTFVDFDHGLNTAVKKLRSALGDSADSPHFIETLSKRGYRFISPVEERPNGAPAVAAAAVDSIVVLPFTNLSPDPENEFFADGITEEIINALAQIEQLHVVARSSAFSFKGKHIDPRIIGERLNVRTVLEGSVRRADNRLRITVQKLCPTAYTRLGDLGEPLRTMAQRIDLLAPTGNGTTAVQRLHPRHHPCDIFVDGQITAHQLLQGSYPVLSVIDRLQLVEVQQFGQLACIDAVTLVAFFQQRIAARIAHHHLRDARLQQVVQPGGPGSFFKGHVQTAAQATNKLQNRFGFRFQDRFHHQLAGRIQNRHRDRCLVNIPTQYTYGHS
jgi:TolB-like protein